MRTLHSAINKICGWLSHRVGAIPWALMCVRHNTADLCSPLRGLPRAALCVSVVEAVRSLTTTVE